jgi:hypothetical protein
MTHPITPPPELVQQWYDQAKKDPCGPINWVAVCAAQWGADQELEACCKWVGSMFHGHKTWADELRNARRPKPPSLKEQALEAAIRLGKKYPSYEGADIETIRRALEELPE